MVDWVAVYVTINRCIAKVVSFLHLIALGNEQLLFIIHWVNHLNDNTYKVNG